MQTDSSKYDLFNWCGGIGDTTLHKMELGWPVHIWLTSVAAAVLPQ